MTDDGIRSGLRRPLVWEHLWYLCWNGKKKTLSRNFALHSRQTHTDQLWAAWETSRSSIGGDYDSRSCASLGTVSGGESCGSSANLRCGKNKKTRQRNCLHLRVSNDVWARITFSLRHGDINSWDTLLNQTLYSAHGSCCCCCKCRKVWEWCFYLAWTDMKTVFKTTKVQCHWNNLLLDV